MGGLLGLLQQDPETYFQSVTRYRAGSAASAELDSAAIDALVAARAAAKQARNFTEADRIRAELHAAGIELDDKPGGITQWRRA